MTLLMSRNHRLRTLAGKCADHLRIPAKFNPSLMKRWGMALLSAGQSCVIGSLSPKKPFSVT